VLGKGLRKYVMKKKQGYDKATRRVYDGRLESHAIQALKDLALLVENLPEEQQAKIFSVENTTPFLTKLFSLESDEPDKRCERVRELWKTLFSIADTTYALKLVGEEVWKLLTSKPGAHLEAVYFAALFR